MGDRVRLRPRIGDRLPTRRFDSDRDREYDLECLEWNDADRRRRRSSGDRRSPRLSNGERLRRISGEPRRGDRRCMSGDRRRISGVCDRRRVDGELMSDESPPRLLRLASFSAMSRLNSVYGSSMIPGPIFSATPW